jgi:transcription elongation factor/antiterminator RfaH
MNTSTNARWYVIYTKTNEEDRAARNLEAWGLEIFNPRIKKKQVNEFTGKTIYFSRPLFPRYLFARFDAETSLHKIRNTRGVQKVLSIDYKPAPVADEIIGLIKSKLAEDGFIRLTETLKRGDEVLIKDGSLKGINGIFDRATTDKSRVMILLTTINYQATLIVERDLVQRAGQQFCTA